MALNAKEYLASTERIDGELLSEVERAVDDEIRKQHPAQGSAFSVDLQEALGLRLNGRDLLSRWDATNKTTRAELGRRYRNAGWGPVRVTETLMSLTAPTLKLRTTRACTDPNKMNGAGDQFPGSDYGEID